MSSSEPAYGVNGTADEQRVVYSSSILFEKQPLEAMEALMIRRQQAKLINKELAEWFTAYGRLRLHYVEELKKIHKRGQTLFTDSSPALQNSKLDALGLCNPLWSDVLNILDDEINLFDQSTRKMGRDMIAPLRLFTRNNDSNLAEMDELSKLASNLQNPEGTSPEIYEDEWARRAPYFFEIFENYDYQRLLLLKDIFLKYQTDVGDVVGKFKKDNENGLEHALNFSVDDEIKRFSQDVIATKLPIENIKVAKADKSRTSTDGFTTSPAAATEPSSTFSSKRHSGLLSPRRFHIKKNGGEHENESSAPSSNLNPDSDQASSSNISKRHTSNTSMLSSNTAAAANNKKEKNSMRSKFGSIFKSHKKGGRDSMYVPPSAIHEPDNASINTETTTGSTRARTQRQRNQSVASNATPSQASVRQYRQQEDQAYKSEGTPSREATPVKQSQHPYRQSTNYSNNNLSNTNINSSAETKPLPQYPLAQKSRQSFQPPPPPPQQQQQQQRPVVQERPTEASLFEPMRPTKRSDSLSSSNVPQVGGLASASTGTSESVATPPITSTSAMTSIPPVSREMENIPESSPLVASPPPPPPPSSRKHLSTDMSMLNAPPAARQPHGSVPVPPSQRRSVSNDQILQPAATGTHQPDNTSNLLAKNTTGGGSLMGGQIMHPSLTTPGLNSSIVELFNATFKDGKLARSNAIGEVAFSFIVDETNKKLPNEIGLQISSKSNGILPNFMVNPMFLQQSATSPGSFSISDPTQISMRTVGGLKYMLNNPTPPIVITPIWKHEDKQSTVIISIKPTSELESYLAHESLSLSNIMVSVSIQNAVVLSAATKPPGSLNKEKGRVTWILPHPIVFNFSKKEERLVARFITNSRASESDTGVQMRFNISNEDGAGRIDFLNTDMEIKASGVSMVEDPFGDGISKQIDDWSEVPTLKSLVAGSYSGHS